jgi:hypothetical protein
VAFLGQLIHPRGALVHARQDLVRVGVALGHERLRLPVALGDQPIRGAADAP